MRRSIYRSMRNVANVMRAMDATLTIYAPNGDAAMFPITYTSVHTYHVAMMMSTKSISMWQCTCF